MKIIDKKPAQAPGTENRQSTFPKVKTHLQAGGPRYFDPQDPPGPLRIFSKRDVMPI